MQRGGEQKQIAATHPARRGLEQRQRREGRARQLQGRQGAAPRPREAAPLRVQVAARLPPQPRLRVRALRGRTHQGAVQARQRPDTEGRRFFFFRGINYFCQAAL